MSSRNSLLIGIALAVVTEVGQALFGADRSGDLVDAIADTVGVILGVLVASRLRRPD